MNKVYQVIWSRVRHCYMAVAETVARSHYKHSSKSAAKATWAAVAAAGLLTGIPACSMAQGSTIAATNQVVQNAGGPVLTKDTGKAKKVETPVFSNKELKKLPPRVPFPMNFMVTDGGTDGVYVTEQRYNNDLKGEHIVLGEGSVAFDRQKGYSGLFAAGINAIAGGKDAIAIGHNASATGQNFSIAIGSNAEAPMSNSIALGEGSIAKLTLSQQSKKSYLTKEDWNGDYNGVLSLGRDLSGARAEVTRRIIHVAGGAADTDAVNVKQLKALAAKIPKAVDLSKYTTTDKLGAVIEQKLGDTYAKKTDIPKAVDLSKYTPTDQLGAVIDQKLGDTYAKKTDIPKAVDLSKYTPTDQLGTVIEQKLGDTYAKKADIPKAVDLSKYTPTDQLGTVIDQKLGDTYAKKTDIPKAKTFKAVGDGISVTEKDNVITYTLDTSKLPQSSTGGYVTEQRYNNDLKGEHIVLGEGSVAFDRQKGYSGLFAAGINAIAGGKDAIAIGHNASATGQNFSIAIGSNAEAPMSNSIALGEGSIAKLTLSQQSKKSYLTKEDWNGDYNGVLSLGRDLSGARAEVTRRIIHVAGGAADTDAVNVKQLKALAAKIPKAVDLSKYTPTDQLGTVIDQKLGDTYAKKKDIPAAKTFKAVGDGISVTEKDNVITYTLDTSKLPQSSTGGYVTEQRYNNDLKGEHIALGEGSVAFDRPKGYSGLFAAGINAIAGGKDAIAIGHNASATGQNFSIAIGSNAEAPMSNSIALGEGSIAKLTLSQQSKKSYLTKEDWNGDYNGVLSLGRDLSGARAEVTRRIIHVAGGAADTDAVNVKQLKALAAKIPKAVDLSKYTTTDKLGAVIEQKLGDTYAKKTDIPKAVDLSKYTPTDQLGTVIDQKLGDTYAKKADIPKAVDLSKYTPTDQLGTVIDQKLGDTYAKKKDIPAAKTFKAVGDGISVTEKDNVITYTLDINKLKTQLSGSSSGGTNGKSAYEVWEEYTDGNGAQPNKGKKESDFLASLKGKDGTNGTNGKSAYEVWEEHKDVNGAQPNKGKSESDFLASLKGKDGTNGITAAQLEQVSQGMQTRMAALGKHMNSMGAGNAALAALHPMEFDPDDKLEAAVGVGHYGDANAAALGMFYHPDENTLISVGGAFGKDKNVMNAGISFRIGKGGNGMLLTKTALATAVKQQNIVIHQQEERIRQLERENKARDAKLAEVLQVLAQVKR